MTKKCIICGREFQAKVGHQKTCGLKCSRENRRRLIVQAHRQRRRISPPEVQLLYRERAEDREARKLAREERRARLTRNDAITAQPAILASRSNTSTASASSAAASFPPARAP